MGYEKRIAVLKRIGSGTEEGGQPLAGVLKIECYAGRAAAEIGLPGARAGKFYAALACGRETCRFPLDLPKTRAELPFLPDLGQGAACLVLEGEEFRPAAFGTFGPCGAEIEEMRRRFIESFGGLADGGGRFERGPAGGGGRLECGPADGGAAEEETTRGDVAGGAEKDAVREREEEIARERGRDYEDEAVASENYYLRPDADLATLSLKSPAGLADGNGRLECNGSAGPADGGGLADGNGRLECNDPAGPADGNGRPECGEAGPADGGGLADGNGRLECEAAGPADGGGRLECVAAGEPYYERIRADLEKVFRENPPEEILNKNVPDSEWVRVRYDDERYYAVGVIRSGGAPAYICYGVPGRYREDPPKELKGYCSYLPLSLFDLRGEGYWMMYQDAVTGECARVDVI